VRGLMVEFHLVLILLYDSWVRLGDSRKLFKKKDTYFFRQFSKEWRVKYGEI
jgi:hypothetical protein